MANARYGDARPWPHTSGNLNNIHNWNFEHSQFSNNLSTSINGPFSKNTDHPHAKFWPYFGQDGSTIVKPADWSYDREVYNLPEGLKGNNFFISKLLLTQISKADQVWIREVLPWTRWDGGMEINWDVWEFNNALLSRTPEQSVSRLLTSKRDQKSATITRYGIAFMAEHGFMMTPQGRIAYAANMQQIVNSVVETLCLGVMEALLFVEYDRWADATVTSMNNKVQMEDKFNVEINDFACVQKGPAGILMRMEDVKQTFRKRTGKDPNMFVFGPGALNALKMMGAALDKTYYVGASATIDSTEKRARVGSGVTLLEMRSVRAPEHAQSINPAEVRTVIGGFTSLGVGQIRGVTPETFRTELLNRDVHVDKADDYYTLQFKKLLQLTGLFVRADGSAPGGGGFEAKFGGTEVRGSGPKFVLSELGRQFYSGYDNWKQYMEERGVLSNWIKSFLSKSVDVQADFVARCIGAEGFLSGKGTTKYTRDRSEKNDSLFKEPEFTNAFLVDLKAQALGAGVAPGAGAAPAARRGRPGAAQDTLQLEINAIRAVLTNTDTPNMAALAVLFNVAGGHAGSGDAKAAQFLYTQRDAMEDGLDWGQASALVTNTLHIYEPTLYARADFADEKGQFINLVAYGVPPNAIWVKSSQQHLTHRNTLGTVAAINALLNNPRLEVPATRQNIGATYLFPPEMRIHERSGVVKELERFWRNPSAGAAVKTFQDNMVANEQNFIAGADAFAGRLGRLEVQRLEGKEMSRVPQNLQKQITGLYYIAQEELDAIYSRRVIGDKTISGAEFVRWMNAIHKAYEIYTGGYANMQHVSEAETGLTLLLSELYSDSLLGEIADKIREKEAIAGTNMVNVFLHSMASLARMHKTMGEAGMEMFHSKITPGVLTQWLQAGSDSKDAQGRGERLALQTSNTMQVDRPGKGYTSAGVARLLESLSIDNADILQWTADNDCWPLLQLVSWAPAKTYLTSPMIALRGYGEAGVTLYGHNRFELGDDPARQVHYGHFTLNAKAQVMDEKVVEHRYHVHVSRYVSGNDGSHWDPNSAADRQRYEARTALKSRIVTAAHPDDDLSSENYMFVTGRPPVELGGDDSSVPSKPEGHESWARFWGLQHPVSLLQQAPYRSDGLRYNTVCFREHSRGAVMSGKDGFDPVGQIELDKGHFGIDYGYPGSSRIYTGGALYLVKPDFSPSSQRLLLNHS